VRPLLALATAPFHVLAIRVTDRIGKGLRTAPRDVLIAQSVPSEDSGRAFGFHRAMDHAGAVIGPLLATALMACGASVPQVFLAAIAPSLLSLIAVAKVKEPAKSTPAATGAQVQEVRARLPKSFASYLAIVGLFALANSSDAFLLLRASEIGVPTLSLPLLWTVLNVSRMTCTYFGGKLADRFSRARLIAVGWIVFAACYFGLGWAHENWQVWAWFLLYGIHTGICEPAERALVRDLAPEPLRGRAYGLFHAIVGIGAIPAGLLTGWLWQQWGGATALTAAACTALVAAGSLLSWERS
jgi:MFS family permease